MVTVGIDGERSVRIGRTETTINVLVLEKGEGHLVKIKATMSLEVAQAEAIEHALRIYRREIERIYRRRKVRK